jgi:glycosidase
MLFDAPLQMKFHEASRQGRDYDMSQIFSGTLVEADPFHAVTLVTNHDTQPLQALEAPVEPGSNRWPMRSFCCVKTASLGLLCRPLRRQL